MAIRFRCRRCEVLLSIGARKAGTDVRCPRCGALQVVPTPPRDELQAAVGSTGGRPQAVSKSLRPSATENATTSAGTDNREGSAPGISTSSNACYATAPQTTAAVAETRPVEGPSTFGHSLANEPSVPESIVVYDYEEVELFTEVDTAAAQATIEKNENQLPAVAPREDQPDIRPLSAAPAGQGSAERVFSDQPPRLPERASPQPPLSSNRSISSSQPSSSPTSPVCTPPAEPRSIDELPRPTAARSAGPDEMVLLPRRWIFMQAWFVFAVCVVSLVGGYWLGRRVASGDRNGAVAPEATRVFLEGLIAWTPMPGQVAGDEGAVVIVLPEAPLPEQPIAVQGLRPVDPPPGELHRGLKGIKQLGGDYTRADREGRFGAAVPKPGAYRLLVISRHAVRENDDPIAQEADFREMERFFQSPTLLVGKYKYQWRTEELQAGLSPLEIHFGNGGK